MLKVHGPFAFSEVGVLAALAGVGVIWVWKIFEQQAARRLSFRIFLAPVLILVVAGGLLQLISSQEGRLARFWQYQLSSPASGQKRFQEVRESVGHFMDSPVFGKGLGFFPLAGLCGGP